LIPKDVAAFAATQEDEPAVEQIQGGDALRFPLKPNMGHAGCLANLPASKTQNPRYCTP
jgi:hypothetical protein